VIDCWKLGELDHGTRGSLYFMEQKLPIENDQIASEMREALRDAQILSLNLIGSPGAGKTSLLEATLQRLPAQGGIALLTGDLHTERDAVRLRRYGHPVRQISTGRVCHLDAGMVRKHTYDWLTRDLRILFIENVGNLVCPTNHDLGEDAKVVVLSVTEGEDKPLKYPEIFQKAELLILSKTDLLPYVPLDKDILLRDAQRINPTIHIIETSSVTGEGLDLWLMWLDDRCEQKGASSAWARAARNF
jgi:hydrogenase nickel incorporation protein HypB